MDDPVMPDPVLQFYEDLADHVPLLFADWRQGVGWQGEILDRLIRHHTTGAIERILDCTCGIGTQSIGLALRGFQVTGTDLSPRTIARANQEAASFGVSIHFTVADLRSLKSALPGEFDVVISCDNALPHLLTDEDLQLAMRNIATKLRPEGTFLATTRDYDQLIQEKPTATTPRVFKDRITFQVWDWWPNGRGYNFQQFILRSENGQWNTVCHAGVYRALQRSELTVALETNGFHQVTWLTPEQSGYYQPIVLARKT
jgi:glycine/sarcosine N-methyltransferase